MNDKYVIKFKKRKFTFLNHKSVCNALDKCLLLTFVDFILMFNYFIINTIQRYLLASN